MHHGAEQQGVPTSRHGSPPTRSPSRKHILPARDTRSVATARKGTRSWSILPVSLQRRLVEQAATGSPAGFCPAGERADPARAAGRRTAPAPDGGRRSPSHPCTCPARLGAVVEQLLPGQPRQLPVDLLRVYTRSSTTPRSVPPSTCPPRSTRVFRASSRACSTPQLGEPPASTAREHQAQARCPRKWHGPKRCLLARLPDNPGRPRIRPRQPPGSRPLPATVLPLPRAQPGPAWAGTGDTRAAEESGSATRGGCKAGGWEPRRPFWYWNTNLCQAPSDRPAGRFAF
jgi:hypothetical protein